MKHDLQNCLNCRQACIHQVVDTCCCIMSWEKQMALVVFGRAFLFLFLMFLLVKHTPLWLWNCGPEEQDLDHLRLSRNNCLVLCQSRFTILISGVKFQNEKFLLQQKCTDHAWTTSCAHWNLGHDRRTGCRWLWICIFWRLGGGILSACWPALKQSPMISLFLKEGTGITGIFLSIVSDSLCCCHLPLHLKIWREWIYLHQVNSSKTNNQCK